MANAFSAGFATEDRSGIIAPPSLLHIAPQTAGAVQAMVPGSDPFARAAREGRRHGARACALSTAWEEFSLGRLASWRALETVAHCYFIGRRDPVPHPPSSDEAGALVRVLCGEQQKFVACTLDIATSTASRRFLDGQR